MADSEGTQSAPEPGGTQADPDTQTGGAAGSPDRPGEQPDSGSAGSDSGEGDKASDAE